jgi:uncharacterized protein YegP (UPF0339 family)
MADLSQSPLADHATPTFGLGRTETETAAYEQFKRDYAARDGGPVAFPSGDRSMPGMSQKESRLPMATASTEPGRQMYFEVYRADRVSLTSALFCGGDWRWRFCATDGGVIAGSGGYSSETACLRAVEALRVNAGTATFRIKPNRIP